MFVIPLLLAAGSLPTLISGAPVPSFLSDLFTRVTSTPSIQKRASSSSYTTYGGDGQVSDGWPAQSDWVSDFTTMLNNNQAILSSSCDQWSVADNSASEISEISSAIQSVSASTGIDARFILAIVLQESNGCVRVPTTNGGVRNPGLMQSHNGAGTCNDGSVQNPCPASEITQMIQDGTEGTSSGDGLKQCLSESGATDVSMYYIAARIYNSGSVASSKNLGQGVATHCYASDVANRLTGWSSGPSGCNSDTVQDLTGTATSNSGSTTSSAAGVFLELPSSTASAAPVVTSTAVVVPIPATTTTAAAVAATSAPAPAASSTTTTTTTSSSSSSDPIYPGAASPCAEYYSVVSGDFCILVEQKTGVSAADLLALNSGLDASCDNLWLGYQYCIQA